MFTLGETNKSLNDWLLQYAGDEDYDQTIRSTLGKLLFSGSSVSKPHPSYRVEKNTECILEN